MNPVHVIVVHLLHNLSEFVVVAKILAQFDVEGCFGDGAGKVGENGVGKSTVP